MRRQFVIRELILDTEFKVIVRSFKKFLYPSVSQPEVILSHKGYVARSGGVFQCHIWGKQVATSI